MIEINLIAYASCTFRTCNAQSDFGIKYKVGTLGNKF